MNEKTYDPSQLASHLEQSFGAEPPHASFASDLAHGRRRLRRARALTSLGGLAVAAVVAGTAVAVPRVLPGPDTPVQVASGAEGDAAVVQDCLGNDTTPVGMEQLTRAELRDRMGDARLMTRVDTGHETVATIRSADGRLWAECTLSTVDPAGVKAFTSVYATDVTFPRTVVDGVRAYEPQSESDPRLEGTAGTPVPQFAVTCDSDLPEETAARAKADAACPTYTLTWNDRRPAEVGKIAVTAPDGKELDAVVRDGYVSLAYTGRMTPEMADAVARGETPGARQVTFYTADGTLLVNDRDPGHFPVDGHLSMANFPSLAWWLKD